MSRLIVLVLLLFTRTASFGQKYALQYVDTKTDASFRGLSVADERAVWVSGSKGWVGSTVDGGKNWAFRQVPGYEKCDFRTIYAFDANNAVIANAGSPAYILRTSDGGTTWKRVYENTDSAAFIDGADFWGGARSRRGIIYGDPIKGHMLLLYTKNHGKTWKERQGPAMSEGEASFAASGTGIRCFMRRTVVIVSGGKVSKLYLSQDWGKTWQAIATPMLAGSASTGIYSFITYGNAWHWLIAGGDYKNDTVRTANCFYSWNKGKEWRSPATTTRGYRECIAQVSVNG